MTLLSVLLVARSSEAQISPGKLAKAHRTLEGATQCVQCHALSRAPMSTSCLNCHKDVKSMLDEKRGYHARLPADQKLACASCHPDHAGEEFDMIAWPGAGKTRFNHRQTGWTLEGKHIDAKCESCHDMKFRVPAMAVLSKRKAGTPWVGLESTCNSCHRTDDIHEGTLKGGCDQCHTAAAWDKAPGFNHDKARYPLTGKHSDVECDACHASSRLTVKRAADGKKIPQFRPITYAKCNDCHSDPHKGRIQGSCTSCHETTGWSMVNKRSFDHSATRYPLAGKHSRVTCAACHGANNEKPIPSYTTCASCHADVHRGEAGPARDCASCHAVVGFTAATFSVAAHAKTSYPLEGKHTSTKCAACHTTASAPATTGRAGDRYVRLKMPSATCGDCHADAHAGQPAVRAATGGCSACHTVNGFSPSLTTVASHAKFRFTLDGAHASATCAACHSRTRVGIPAPHVETGRANFAFTIGETACASCHADPHTGRYLANGVKANLACANCHGTSKFRPSTVTAAEHGKLGYAIEGAHRAVGCAGCHEELKSPPGDGSLILSARNLPALPFAKKRGAACAGCHEQSHGTQFAKRKDGGQCESCHTVDRFAGASRFDHAQTRFPLAGAHATVTCLQCHPTLPSAPQNVPASARLKYAGIPVACESCHAAASVSAR